MKKVFFLAAMSALMLASCGNKTQANDAATDSDSVASAQVTSTDGETVDASTLSADNQAAVEQLTGDLQKAIDAKDTKAAASTLAELHNKYKELIDAGNLEEAKAYGSAIKAFVDKNADQIKTLAGGNTTVVDLVNGIANLPTSAAATVEDAKAALNSDAAAAKAAAELAKTAASTAAKDAAAKVATDAKSTANQAVTDTKAAAANKVSSEVNKATSKVNSEVSKAAAKADAKAAEAKAKTDAAKQKAAEAVNKAANTKVKDLIK